MFPLEQVETLFHQALALKSEDRLPWLKDRCGDDKLLLHEVCSLLEANAAMTGGLKTANPAAGIAPPQQRPVPSDLFGAWKAVRLIGHGGMSSVYLAERADGQFRQTVALKVMAGYLADPEFVRRFEAERQFLASLNHRGITRLLDGGVSSKGDPFLITEYVDGEPIDRYCDRHKLNTHDRVRIFLQVCEAVDYAHRNLIVHRDLKPANILVNQEGEVKLLDFGTAALNAPHELQAVTRMRMLTPRYASPEQLRGERVNISTDVFSLGVVLYELLAGAWPFGDPDSIVDERERSLGRATAKLLSSAVTDQAAEVRSTSTEQLRRTLKGDLSAVVLRALEPDPARRYPSVGSLAADLENVLAQRPVSARPQTAWYRAQKFLRRRWLFVSAAAAVIALVAGAALIAIYQARVARAEALKAENVNRFLDDMLSSSARRAFDPQTFTVAQMLESTEARLDSNWSGDARTEATLRRSLGSSYLSLMRFDRARPQLEKALAIFRSLHDEKEIAWTEFRLAELSDSEGRAAEAAAAFEQVLAQLKRLGRGAPPLLTFMTENELGNELSLILNRRLPEARAFLDDAIAIGGRDSSIPRTELATAMAHRAIMLQNEGKSEDAEVMYRRALAIGRQEDPNGFWQADPLFGLATLIAPKDPAGAAEFSRERYQLLATHLGPDHAETAISKILWARQRADAGQLGDAPGQVIEAMAIVRQRFLPSSMDRWFALSSSAHVLNKAGRYREAESLAREMLPILEANHLPDNDGRRAECLLELGKALHGEGKDPEARAALTKAAGIYDSAGPPMAGMANWARIILAEIK